MFSKFSRWFRRHYIPRFLRKLDKELWTVDLNKWLEKYPIKYRKAMLEAIDNNHISTKGLLKCGFKAFAKVEQQFTNVPHDLKETPLNDVKERQICGPSDEKKVWGNPFINLLEEVATKYWRHYCGRKNWIKICRTLKDGEGKILKPIWGESDGSGFDMTQFLAMNQLMNELILAAARHQNVTWVAPLSIDRLEEALQGSLVLNVSVDNGMLKYQADGRASGDGWTTFGNTMLMIAYWEFTFETAGIAFDNYFLQVKGDDVLFCVSEYDRHKLEEAISQVFTKSKDQHKWGLGQICKKVKFGPLVDLSFLSNEFFMTSQGEYRMTRIPARVLQTMSWSTKLPPQKLEEHRKMLCFSKGKCLKAWADGLPIFGVLADKMIALGKEGKVKDYNQYADEDRIWHQGRNDWDAYLFYLDSHYGVQESEVLEVEKAILGVSSLKGLLHLPQLEKLYFT